MPPASRPVRVALTRRFQQSIATVSTRASLLVQRMWDNLASYDEPAIATLAARSDVTMAAVKASAFRSATGYYSVLAGVRPPPLKIDELDIEADMREPFIATWRAFAQGRPYEQAVSAGRSRVEALVANYAISAARQTGDLVVAKANLRVSGWERIPDSGACEWCLGVAEDTYSSADAADFGHDRCGCTAAPAFD